MGVGKEASTAVYYRFQDASGRTHIVDSLDSVPQAARPQAQRIEYQPQPEPSVLQLPHTLSTWQIFGLGFVAALLVTFLFRRLPGTMRLVLRMGIIGAVIVLLGGAYLGWMRRTTGQRPRMRWPAPPQSSTTPRGAVEKMNARMAAEQAEIKEARAGEVSERRAATSFWSFAASCSASQRSMKARVLLGMGTRARAMDDTSTAPAA